MESMVTEPESIKREIDISNDIREGEENVYGSPIPGPQREASRSVNEEITGASSDNVNRILASGCAKTWKARMPESRNTKNQNTKIKAGSLLWRKHKRKRKSTGKGTRRGLYLNHNFAVLA